MLLEKAKDASNFKANVRSQQFSLGKLFVVIDSPECFLIHQTCCHSTAKVDKTFWLHKKRKCCRSKPASKNWKCLFISLNVIHRFLRLFSKIIAKKCVCCCCRRLKLRSEEKLIFDPVKLCCCCCCCKITLRWKIIYQLLSWNLFVLQNASLNINVASFLIN